MVALVLFFFLIVIIQKTPCKLFVYAQTEVTVAFSFGRYFICILQYENDARGVSVSEHIIVLILLC